jgi:hypothetical protein
MYQSKELAQVLPLLERENIVLEEKQPHMQGERFLMQAMTTTSGKKLILVGRNTRTNARVIIKATSDEQGALEIEHERLCRSMLGKLDFAYDIFHAPRELLYTKRDGLTMSVQEYIEQESPFLDRALKEQFTLALTAFKAQESAHASTYGHLAKVQSTFGEKHASTYIDMFRNFEKSIIEALPKEIPLHNLLKQSEQELVNHADRIERYCGFLTHVDFVPHNFRVVQNTIYLLDNSSLRFGNKHEGWARFINFMTLYNPPLEQALVEYVRLNRANEELESLRLMRLYRLGEIMCYYARLLSQTTGDLHTLNRARVIFWSNVLEAILENKPLSPDILDSYKKTRDSLRSPEEKERQIGLH